MGLDGILELLDLILGRVDISVAHSLLLVIRDLLLPEQGNHIVDHLDHLREADLLTTNGEGDEVQAEVLLAMAALQSLERALPQLLLADLHLQEGGARQRFLKSSSASSSLRILIVSAIAASS